MNEKALLGWIKLVKRMVEIGLLDWKIGWVSDFDSQ